MSDQERDPSSSVDANYALKKLRALARLFANPGGTRGPGQSRTTANEMLAAGLTQFDLVCLTSLGYIRQVRRQHPSMKSAQRSDCVEFTLTDRGRRMLLRLPDVEAWLRRLLAADAPSHGETPASRLHWDCCRRQLRIDGQLALSFRKAAPLQEAILTEFQRLGWPNRIDDPLPRDPLTDPKVRLHDTVRRLNSKLRNLPLRFRSDGQGQGICWQFME